MQQLCIWNDFNLLHVSHDNDWSECVCNSGNVRDNGGNVPPVGEFRNSWGDVCNSGDIEYVLGNLRVEIVINNSA